MLKKTFTLLIAIGISLLYSHAQIAEDSTQIEIDNIENSLEYETGVIALQSGNANITVPKGFRYLNAEQSKYVLSELWGNPVDSSVLGLLVPEDRGVLATNSWVFTISYEEIGYVKDDDAADIDYDDLLKEQQKEFEDANPSREAEGYPPIQFIGWAAKPYYDEDKKVLHWAKELKFGSDSLTTLNYNLRVLGKKGVFVLNAIASMSELVEVEPTVNNVLASVEFEKGNTYFDFDPEVDQVAAWTVGGLVAGKILAKIGFFAVILKFWKLIAIALASGGAYLWKFITGRKKEVELANSNKNTENENVT